MAYIATKATYVGEDEILDENGEPIVDENNVPVKRIKTDVDDVIFSEGEVIVLIEKVTKGKHFDLNIEDEDSTYFAPTQIKIGDGIHSFQELNWLQTIDSNKIDTAVNNSVHKVVAPIISDFVNYQSKEILKELVSNNFFRINSMGGLVGFTTDSKEYAGKYCMSIGDNTSIEKKADGYTIGIGKNNLASSDYSLIIGTNNESIHDYSYLFGDHLIAASENQTVFGKYNVDETESDFYNLFVVGNGTDDTRSNALTVDWGGNLSVKGGIMSIGDGNSVESSDGYGGGLLALGSNNTASGMYSLAFGMNNTANGSNSFALGQNLIASGEYQTVIGTNNKEEPYSYVFIIGNGLVDGSDEDRSNAIAVDWNGHLEISGGIKTLGMNNYTKESESDPGHGGVIAMGDRNSAYGLYSVAIGTICSSRGSYSLSIGDHCISAGDCSIAMGKNCSTDYDGENIGHYAISMGENNGSYGKNSVTIGKELTTFIDNQTVIGKYNDYSNDAIRTYAFVIGNGTTVIKRSNALTVDWDGNAVFAGDVTATMTDGSTISLIDIFNRIGTVEEQLATLVTPEETA